jgi:hypothetical protein
MSPELLVHLLDRLATAAEVVEAIDDRGLAAQRGWDLSDWRYELVPWGVRFCYQGIHGQGEVLAVIARRGKAAAEPRLPAPAPTTVLLFG